MRVLLAHEARLEFEAAARYYDRQQVGWAEHSEAQRVAEKRR